MKNLLFINCHMNPGGTEKSLLDILCNLDFSQYDVELLLLEEYGSYINEIPDNVKIKLVDLHNTYGSVFSCVKRCIIKRDWKSLWIRFVFLCVQLFGVEKLKLVSKTIVGTKKYDCVIGFRPGIATGIAAYAVNAREKITWWHHGEINMNSKQQQEYDVECKKMSHVVVVSKGCADMLTERFPTIKSKIKVIPNMIDIDVLLKKSKAYEPFEKKDTVCDIVTVGRLSSEKHVENAIAAAATLKACGRHFRWFIVGDGDQRNVLEQQALEQNLSDAVFFTGNKANPYPYLKYADMMVHTSYVESQCLVVLEAMALGTPCVVTESLGPKEYCVDGENCILVGHGPEALVLGISKMMNSFDTMKSMIADGKRTALNYDARYIIGKIQKLIS